VTLVPPRVVKRSQYRSNVGNCQNAADYYRVNVYVPLLDTVVSDIKNRFSAHQRQSFALAGLIPSQLKDWDSVKAAVEKYADSLDSVSLVEGEYHGWSQYWSTASDKMKHSTAISALNVCPAMFYPNINSLLRILATLPSTTAEPERVFSKVTKTLSAVRSSMSEERLEACVLLQVHRDKMPETSAVKSVQDD
jgi:hAT family C-terminal dimerisation region